MFFFCMIRFHEMDGSDKVNVLCLNIEDNVKLMLYLHLSDTF